MNLPLPWDQRIKLTRKQLALGALGLVVFIGCVLLFATGQIKAGRRLFYRMMKRYNEEKLNELEVKYKANVSSIIREEKLREDLEVERKHLVRKRTEAEHKIKGMSHAEVVAELNRRGF